ncbi:hypothetical protein NDI43_25535 [Microcoleus vaginatus GB2-A3]
MKNQKYNLDANRQQSTANRQQLTANTQQSTVNNFLTCSFIHGESID